MDYKKIYNKDYFTGKGSFFYKFGYDKFQGIHFNKLFNPIKKYISKIKVGKVLDVGCAYGFMLKKFPKEWERHGIDVSKYAISEAKKIIPNAKLKIGNAEDRFNFNNKKFDIIIMNDVLEHLQNPERALENVYRALKTKGIFYITTPNLNFFRKTIYKKADRLEHHVSLFKHKELSKILKQIGFKIKEDWTFIIILGFLHFKFKSNLGVESAFICKK